ncbi:hypothetical protein E5676_scaffold134G001420 [Cucumis melo var. makuwa]|uniref:Uncharacterized protein n=1 Tax=Cucumis melo var. makuwa TaxID=1194695 RepID=A0A5D3D8Z2_CUCMM|nr:hypothetical protein E6C27_scaffold255G002870 [Cucumis melo var. makuwa]TYK20024.1 hypothetical protein E5676_scaffold134G001420 [Cucumis melo var. makuwa]
MLSLQIPNMRAGPKETLQDIFNFLGSVSFFEYQRISLAVRASNEITQEESDCSLLADFRLREQYQSVPDLLRFVFRSSIRDYLSLGFVACELPWLILMEAPISSRGWSKRGRSLSNQGLFAALPVTQMDMLSANGVEELASLFLEIICFVKFLPETLAVSFVPAR